MTSKYQGESHEIELKSKDKISKYQYDLSKMQDQLRILHEEKINTESKNKFELENLRKVTKELHERLGLY